MLTNLPLDRPLAVFDLETTGVEASRDRIVEISILKLAPGAPPEHKTRRVNPGIPIPPGATAVHGIGDADVAACPPFARIAPGVVAFLEGCDLAGYYILRFDLRLLIEEFRRAGVAFPLAGRRLIDPLRIFHARERRDLTGAVKFYCNADHEGAHGAAADVLATVAVLDAQLARYADLPRTVGELHDQIRDPAAVDLGEFLTRDAEGAIIFAKGKHGGERLDDLARRGSSYLPWVLQADFYDDTKQFIREAMERAGAAPARAY